MRWLLQLALLRQIIMQWNIHVLSHPWLLSEISFSSKKQELGKDGLGARTWQCFRDALRVAQAHRGRHHLHLSHTSQVCIKYFQGRIGST